MGSLFMLLGGVFYLVAFVCGIIVLVDAFKNEVWKGLLCILCGFYGLYYMFVEFEHENKAMIIAGNLLGSIAGMVCMSMGVASMHAR